MQIRKPINQHRSQPRCLKRRVVFLACPNTQIVDFAGPAEIFARTASVLAGRSTAEAGYSIELVSTSGETLTTSCGISLVSHGHYKQVHGTVDTLLVVGGPDLATVVPDPAAL